MKSLARSSLLALAFAANLGHAAAPDPALVGCWRAAKIVQYSQDGSKVEDTSGRCILRFSEDQLASTCATASGSVTSTYRYRVDRPNVYTTTMVGSTFRTDLVGSTREYEYHLDGERLSTASQLQNGSGLRVETESEKVACP